MDRENYFHDAVNGLIIFLGEEPWFRLDLYAQGFFQALRELGIKQAAAVEGVNGPAPPDLEHRITCAYGKADMKEGIQKLGVHFTNYSSECRRGTTIGMAMVSKAHFEYPDIWMFSLWAMAPLYPLMNANGQPVGIPRDHRSFYDAIKQLKAMFSLDIDLRELKQLGDVESQELQGILDKLGEASKEAKHMIDKVRSDYSFTPFGQHVELDPALDQTLEDILRNMPGPSYSD